MNIALIGYGKMGREIEQILKERGHNISIIIDKGNYSQFCADYFKDVDVAIEFSVPQMAYENIIRCFELGVNVVCGTSAWLDRLSEVEEKCRENNVGFFYASNYSIGVNIFRKINSSLAQYMNIYTQYEATMYEEHHAEKIDHPSGTAITLATELIEQVERKNGWCESPTLDQSKLGIAATRRGNVPGTHNITWESVEDKIEITHTAKGRRGFAVGAVIAAEFLAQKRGVYSMNDLLSI